MLRGLMRTLALSLSVCLALAAPASAQVLPHAPEVERLPNGLSVVFVPYDSPGITAYFTLVRTGSRDEVQPGRSGFAHLFEHMMFRGTRTMSGHDYELRMQRLGADNNAYTTEDYTLYTVTLPTTSVDDFIAVEADRFQHLSYAEQAFQTETRAVLGEYNKSAANPVSQMWESLAELTFTRHTYGHTTIGYLRDVRAMPGLYTFSQQFFRQFYTPDNCTVIVAGDFDRARVLARVREAYGPWRGRRANPTVPQEPAPTAPRRRDLAWEGTSPRRMLVGYRVPAFSLESRDNAALEVLHALAFSASSDLYQRLVVQRPRLLALQSWAGSCTATRRSSSSRPRSRRAPPSTRSRAPSPRSSRASGAARPRRRASPTWCRTSATPCPWTCSARPTPRSSWRATWPSRARPTPTSATTPSWPR